MGSRRVFGILLPLMLASSFAMAITGCSDDETSPPPPVDSGFDAGVDVGVDVGFDDAFDDAGFDDAGFPDAGPQPDVGARFAAISCASCSGGCPSELCLRNPAGETFCADRCDADLEACIDGFSCLDISGGSNPTFFCIPPGSTCAGDGSGYGARCSGSAATCPTTLEYCEGDVVGVGYCTGACASDFDCPSKYECLFGDDGDPICKPTFTAPIEQCARGFDLSEIPCGVDTDCRNLPDSVCVRTAPSLPGVCAVPCSTDEDCGDRQCLDTNRGSVCLSDRCACHAEPSGQPGRDLLGEALAAIGLDRCSAIFSLADWANVPGDILFDPYRLDFFDPIHNQPLSAPAFGEDLVLELEAAADNGSPAARAARLVQRMAELVDQPAVLQVPNPIDPVEPLATAMADLIREAGGQPVVADLQFDANDVPMDLQLAVAEVIDGLRRAVVARRRAVDPGVANDLYAFGPAFVARRADGRGFAPAQTNVRQLLTTGIGYAEMYGAAVDLLDAIDRADLGRFQRAATSTIARPADFLFNQPTPLGRVVIAGAESHLYRPDLSGQSGPWALLIDLGGNDEYRVPAGGNVSAGNLASVAIDLGGEDLYAYVEVPDPLDGDRLPSDAGGRYTPAGPPTEDNGPISLSEVPRQGGGRVGTGILIDLGGDDDVYRSLRMSQGAGLFGTGVLIDDGGNDTYDAETVAQGSAAFGIGLHLDLGGRDTRRAYQMSQGFAYALAAGLSFDVDGDDVYFLDPGDPDQGGDPLYFSAQRPGRANSTLGQGFGFGRRADFTDRAFMSGGIGIVIDGRGDDRYTGGIFAQGGGFWFGAGLLADRAGDDVYDAMWYAMATGAHYGLGLLLEGDGNDRYGDALSRINVTVAGAHDYTAAFLIDAAGDDDYRGSRISLGAGNVNGMGVFVDTAGNDLYDVRSSYALGSAGLLERGPSDPGSARRKVDSVGVFIDAAGDDTYTLDGMPMTPYANDSTWLQTNSMDPIVAETELGVGIDGEGFVSFDGR